MSEPHEVAGPPVADIREEGLRIVRAAAERELPVRMLGGVAVWVRCPSARRPELARSTAIVDLHHPGRSAGGRRFLEAWATCRTSCSTPCTGPSG